MHTIMVIGGGLLLLAIMALVGRMSGHLIAALLLFLPVWLAAACYNMWWVIARAAD
jgi:hypothetical protein